MKDKNISIKGNVAQIILITGDHNKILIGDLGRFQDVYLPASPVFERVELENFVGRKWLFDELDDFIQKNDRGYFLLEAAAGLGKTAFLAYLVNERGYFHHFVELAPGEPGIAIGLKNLALQLAIHFKLEPFEIEED